MAAASERDLRWSPAANAPRSGLLLLQCAAVAGISTADCDLVDEQRSSIDRDIWPPPPPWSLTSPPAALWWRRGSLVSCIRASAVWSARGACLERRNSDGRLA